MTRPTGDPHHVGKVGHARKADARRQLRRTQSTPGRHPGRLIVYRCRTCGLWHIGHRSG